MTGDGYAQLALFFIVLLVAIAIGPWALLVIAEWILSPRSGSWAIWAHGIGAGWFAIVVLLFVIGRLRG